MIRTLFFAGNALLFPDIGKVPTPLSERGFTGRAGAGSARVIRTLFSAGNALLSPDIGKVPPLSERGLCRVALLAELPERASQL